jgi:two-component system cell cycle sensor histidine kinase/response regulator CckA
MTEPASHESRRLAALRPYAILDTDPESIFDELTALAAQVCEAPIAGIVFLDEYRQVVKSGSGLHLTAAPCHASLAEDVLRATDLLEVRDLDADPRRVTDQLIRDLPSAHFYAGVPLLAEAGDPIGVLFVIGHRARALAPPQAKGLRTIGHQVMAQMELRRQSIASSNRERLLQTIIDSEPECVKLVALDGTLKMMNPAGLRMIQADSADQVVGRPLLPMVAPEHRSAFMELTEHVFQGGQGSLEFLALGLKGAQLWLETHAVPLRDDAGSVVALLAITRDVTDRKTADDARRQSEANLRMLFEQASDGIFVTDPTGITLDANEAACTLTGYSRDELVNHSVTELVHPDEVPRIAPEIERLSCGGIVTTEWRMRLKDGTFTTVEARAKQLPDGRLQAFVRDITDRRQAELAQQRLAQAHKMEMVGRLAGGIAHDFNNLLTVINATADVVMSNAGEYSPHAPDLRQIRQAGDRASTLTRQLLALSRQQPVKPEVMNLNALVANMDDMLRRLIGEDVELRLELAGTIGSVVVDASQIEQVILNLVLNARDAMPDGGRLTITTEEIDLDAAQSVEFPPAHPGRHVMLAIRDDGVGMDETTRERLFEPFFTTKEQGRGTGLGLAMVYAAVKNSGGTLRVESERGQGTTVAVYMPKTDALPVVAPYSVSTRTPATQRGTETVLIVEDEPALRGLARRILEHAGYKVLEASSGEEALALLGRYTGAVDLMFTDVVMPRMNGRVLAQQVAQVRPHTKVLFASGYTDDAILRRGVLDDPRHFLAKPYTAAVLRAKIRGVLDS